MGNTNVILTKETHYTLTRTDDYTHTVSLNMDAVRNTADSCRQVMVVFTAEGTYTVADNDTTTYFNNTAKNNYAYGDLEVEKTVEGNKEYQNRLSKKHGTLGFHLNDASNNSYGWNLNDGIVDYVYCLELRDDAFKNRGTKTHITIVDTLPSITLMDGTNRVIPLFNYMPGSIKASVTNWDNEYYGQFITPINVTSSGNSFTAEFDIPENWPSDVVLVYYNCTVTDEYRENVRDDQYIQQGWYGPAVNRASVTWDGNTQNISNSSSVNIKDDRVSKNSQLVGTDGQFGYSHITYTVKVNPSGVNLDPNSDTLTLTDRFSNGASQVTYNRASFVVKDSSGNVLTRSDSVSDSTYLLTFSEGGDSFNITVPDGKSLSITYDVLPVVEKGDRIENLSNSITLTGVNRHNSVNGFMVSGSSEGADTTLKEDERGVKINKEETGSGLLLQGAVFKLYTVDADGELIETGKSRTSSAIGLAMFHIPGTDLDQVYAVKEDSAPEGYVATDNVWYFYCKSRDGEGNVKEIPAATQAIIDKVKATVLEPDELTYEFTAHNEKLAYEPVSATLPLTKTLNHAFALKNEKNFEFKLTEKEAQAEDGSAKQTGWTVTQNTANASFTADSVAEQTVSNAFALTFSEPGTYTFEVQETIGTDAAVTYDSTVYTVVYQVTEGESGLRVDCTINKEATQTEAVAFVNTVAITEVTVQKVWQNADGSTTAPDGAKVVFTLCANGEATEYTVTLDGTADDTVPTVTGGYESAPWTASFVNLPKQNAEGAEIAYTVQSPRRIRCMSSSALARKAS